MKKHLLVILLLCLSASCFAQEQEPEDVLGPTTMQQNHNLLSGMDAPNGGFGIKGGANFANVYGDEASDLGTSMLTSFHAGVFAQIPASKSFSVQIEALYSRKGFEADADHRFDYLELPLLAVINITDNFSLHVGPQLSVMIAAKQDGKELSIEDMNTFDYGAAAGAEARISRFRLGARYNLGLAALLDDGDTGLPFGSELKNNVAQVYLGIGF